MIAGQEPCRPFIRASPVGWSPVTPSAIAFPTQLVESGYYIRTMQELLGHKDVKTTMIYTHVLHRGGKSVKSPVDDL
jgi:hypothetical protein